MARRVKEEIRNDELGIREEGGRVLFRRSIWKGGLMNYECGLCAYATLQAMKMAGHLRAVHGIVGGTAAAGESDAPTILIEENEVR